MNRSRVAHMLSADMHTDIAVVGGGIAGVSTAYFILKNTTNSVVLVEADKVAHGATGHNAGQITSYFEKPLVELVDEFGLQMAGDGQRSVESAWSLLLEIARDIGVEDSISDFTGYAGFATVEQVIHYLRDGYLRIQMGLESEPIIIALEASIPETDLVEFYGLYTVVPQAEILKVLQTGNTQYIGAVSSRKGCMNSALFCEELASYLVLQYPGRFALVEHTPVSTISLEDSCAILRTSEYTITTGRVVLCTNGFENINITNKSGLDIDGRYHDSVYGIVGYMAGYIDSQDRVPTAISYMTCKPLRSEDPYYYLTRRPFINNGQNSGSLVCVGGPENILQDRNEYMRRDEYPSHAQKEIDNFIRKNYVNAPTVPIHYTFRWHGLMGFTKNKVRMIGADPCNSILLYNLGCNGVGILPSIYGGWKIADTLLGSKQEPSIFDIRDGRCWIG